MGHDANGVIPMLTKLVASSKLIGRIVREQVAKTLEKQLPDDKPGYQPLIRAIKDAQGINTQTVQDLVMHARTKYDCWTLIQYLRSEAARNIDYMQRAEMVRELFERIRLLDILSHLH
jgi:hypothetical protein